MVSPIWRRIQAHRHRPQPLLTVLSCSDLCADAVVFVWAPGRIHSKLALGYTVLACQMQVRGACICDPTLGMRWECAGHRPLQLALAQSPRVTTRAGVRRIALYSVRSGVCSRPRQAIAADTSIQLELMTGVNHLSMATIPRLLKLNAGEEVDLGLVEFEAARAWAVSVVDERGMPVEGIPLRVQRGTGKYAVAAVTNVLGEATVLVDADLTLKVRAVGIPESHALYSARNLEVKASDDDKPIVISLTDDQIAVILKPRPVDSFFGL